MAHGPNYEAVQADMTVSRNGRVVADLHPEKRVYHVQRTPTTEAAIEAGFTRDLYVSMGDMISPDTWTFRLHVKPFVDWIWGGCLLMACGGFLAISDRRYRVRPRKADVDDVIVVPIAPTARCRRARRPVIGRGRGVGDEPRAEVRVAAGHLFFALGGFFAVGLHLDPREVPSPLIGKAAPDFALARLDAPAQTIHRTDMLGKVWMLNVWASWCEACRDEHPHLVEFAKLKACAADLRPQLQGHPRPGREAWLAAGERSVRCLAVRPSTAASASTSGVYGVPETFVIEKQGVIRFKHIGPLTPEVLRDRVLPLVRSLNG